MMLRWLARSAAEKARAFSKGLEEFIFTDEPDPVVDELIARSATARQRIADWPESKVDALITDLAAQLAGHADELAAATVTETGMGCVADKMEKNLFGSLGVAKSLVGKPGVGVIGERESLAEIADPMGVVLGLIPVTNPVSTLVGQLSPACGEGRGAHPGPAPPGPDPPRGVGPGNAPAWVCADAGLEAAARMVVASKGFDHGLICGSENNLVVDRSVLEAFIGALRQAGAAVLNAAERERLAQVAFDGAPEPRRARAGGPGHRRAGRH